VAFLAPEPFDLTDGHALDSQFVQGIFDFLQLEGLDDRFNFLHIFSGVYTPRAQVVNTTFELGSRINVGDLRDCFFPSTLLNYFQINIIEISLSNRDASIGVKR
jgi:hypothetical protein